MKVVVEFTLEEGSFLSPGHARRYLLGLANRFRWVEEAKEVAPTPATVTRPVYVYGAHENTNESDLTSVVLGNGLGDSVTVNLPTPVAERLGIMTEGKRYTLKLEEEA